VESTDRAMDQDGRLSASQTEDERYRLLIEAVTDYAIYMLDHEGIVSSWNPGAQRFKGYQASEIIGQHFSRFTAKDRKAGLPKRALDTARREGKFESEGWRVRKDGSRFWAYVVIDPIRKPSGEVVGYAKITRDLTERRNAEAVLKASQEQFRLLVQGVTDYAIYMLDRDGRVPIGISERNELRVTFPTKSLASISRFSTAMRIKKPACRKSPLRPRRGRVASKKKDGESERMGRAFWPMSSLTRSALTTVHC
jgi:PAS domain S-box-containing protein